MILTIEVSDASAAHTRLAAAGALIVAPLDR